MSKVTEIIAETFETQESNVSVDKALQDFDMWDSMTHMILIGNIENAFQIELTNDEIVEMQTVSDIIKVLEKRNIRV